MRQKIIILALFILVSVSLTSCGFGFGMTGKVVQAVPNAVLGNRY